MYTHSSQYRDTGWADEVKNVTALNALCQGIFSRAILDARAVVLLFLI
jgi:hypothetical protein